MQMTRRGLLFCLLVLLMQPVVLNRPALANPILDNNRAVTLIQSGQYQEGLDLFKQTLEKLPFDDAVRNNLSNAYVAAGIGLLRKKDHTSLVELMLEAQEFDDSRAEFWLLRGQALLRLQRYDEAEIDLLEARSILDPDVQVLSLLGELYYDTDRMYQALDVMETAAQLDSANHAVGQMLKKIRQELAVEQNMNKEYGGHFVITFDGEENPDLGKEILDVLEDAYNDLGSRLDHFPEQRVSVILYSRQQFHQVTRSPDWSGGLYDGKIRLPIGGITRVDTSVRRLLYHEYMHVMLRDMAGQQIPFWLNEGLAELVERELGGEPDFIHESQRAHRGFTLAQLEKSFLRFDGVSAVLAYEESYSFVRFLIDQYGWHKVRELLFTLGGGRKIAEAVDQVFGDYSLSYAELERRWRESTAVY